MTTLKQRREYLRQWRLNNPEKNRRYYTDNKVKINKRHLQLYGVVYLRKPIYKRLRKYCKLNDIKMTKWLNDTVENNLKLIKSSETVNK